MRRSRVLGWTLLVLVGYLVLVPLVAVLLGAVRNVPLDVPGPFTLRNLRLAGESLLQRGVLRDTVVFAVGSTAVSLAIGGYLAWVTERAAVRLRSFIYALVASNLIIPGILSTIAWILLLHERIGIGNGALRRLGLGDPFSAYALPSMIWVDGSDGFALPFLLIAAALRATHGSFEEAAVMSGASRSQTLRTVTMPLLRPAIMAAALLSFIRSLGTFVVPITMGVPGGVRVLATEVYFQSRLFPSDANLAAAYAVIHLLFAAAALGAYQFATRGTGRFVTVVGSAGAVGAGARGSRSLPHAPIAVLISATVVLVPAAVTLYVSFLPFYQDPWSGVAPDPILRNYLWLFESGVVRRALVNSLVIGTVAALGAALLSLLVAWQVVRWPGRRNRMLDLVASLPIALPGTVLALALLWWYLYLPLPLYGTRWVLIIGLLTTFLPYGIRTLQGGLLQIGAELEEASTMSGAGRMMTLTRIVIPLLVPGTVAATLYMISRSFKALAIPALLRGPGLEMVPTVIYELSSDARYSELSALGVVLSLGLAALTLFARALVGRRAGAS